MAEKKRLGTDPFAAEKTLTPEPVAPTAPAAKKPTRTSKPGTRTSPARNKKAAPTQDMDEVLERLARLESEMKSLQREMRDLQQAASCMNPLSWWRYWFPF